MKKRILIFVAVLIGTGIFKTVQVCACPIPVFRYALEFWEADPYSIEIFYDSSFSSEEQELVNYLLRISADRGNEANLQLRNIDIRGDMDDITKGYLNNISPSRFPWIVVRYPRVSGINKVIWSGPLNRENVIRLVHSPARESIATRLASDATAVWVLLESGDRRKDNDAFNLLSKELSRLEQTLVLPDLELWWDNPGGEEDGNEPVIKFDIVRVSRGNPEEVHFMNMLINSEDDLFKFNTEPIVYPVYGRGIALWAIVGRGINEWNIREAAEFLTGPCSCQAKLLNPGLDMLIAMDWDGVIENITDMSISNPLSGMGDFTSREEEVRRQLESATAGRLGSDSEKSGGRSTDPERVVYLDIFREENREGDRKEVSDGKDNTTETRSALEVGDPAPQQETTATDAAAPDRGNQREQLALSDRPAVDDTRAGTAAEPGPRPLTHILLAVLAGIILIVLLTGIYLYRRN